MPPSDLDKIVPAGLEAATRSYRAGDTETAIQMLEYLESLARPNNHPGLAYALIQRAGWLRELGRPNEARAALQEAEESSRKLPPAIAPVPALKMEQGIVARQAGDLPRAEALLDEARELVKGSPLELAMMSDLLANLSSVYSDQGRTEDAQSALLQALEFDEKTGDQRAQASNLNMLGLLYSTAGDRKTARIYLTRSKEIASDAGLVKELADATHNLAILSDQEGSASEAKKGFLSALEAAERSRRSPDIASAKTSLGILAARDGNFQQAHDLLASAFAIHSELGLPAFSISDLINLSQVSLSLNDPAGAWDYIQQAFALIEQHGLIESLWAVHLVSARVQMARLKQASNPSRAEVEAVLASYSKSADAIELMRSGIGRPEERAQLLVDKEVVYEEGMLMAGLLHHGSLAWSFAERARGRSFLDSLGESRVRRQAQKHPLARRRAEVTEQLLSKEGRSAAETQSLLDELRLTRSQIAAQAPNVAALTETELPTIAGIAALIPPDSAIVEFFFGPGARLTAFVINQKGFAAMHTTNLGTLDVPGMVEQFRAELQYEVPDEPTGMLLFSLLFVPVWDAIDPVGRLFIVPHKELHYVPFPALWFKNSGEGPEHLYLCQRFQTTVLPSASYFAHMMRTERRMAKRNSALFFGNPTQDLPGSEVEATAVAKLFGKLPLLGKYATRADLLGNQDRCAVIHVASHGVYDQRDPLLSGILMADGRVSVDDLLDSQIPADLLTLSGCLTGMTGENPGDELVGLSRAALVAGASSVITTLWEVADDPSREFFARFYQRLISGCNKDQAFMETQHSMLADPHFNKPSNWAPYVLLGDSR